MELNLYNILDNVLNEADGTYQTIRPDIPELVKVIQNKTCVVIDYDDERPDPPRGDRMIEPCALGYTKANNLALRAYEYEGKTRRGVPKWKLFRIDRIQNWKETRLTFNVKRELYNDLTDNSLHGIIAIADFKGLSDIVKRNLDLRDAEKKKRTERKKKKNQRGPVPNPAIPTGKGQQQETPPVDTSDEEDFDALFKSLADKKKSQMASDMNDIDSQYSWDGMPKNADDALDMVKDREAEQERKARKSSNQYFRRKEIAKDFSDKRNTIGDKYKYRSNKKLHNEPLNDFVPQTSNAKQQKLNNKKLEALKDDDEEKNLQEMIKIMNEIGYVI